MYTRCWYCRLGHEMNENILCMIMYDGNGEAKKKKKLLLKGA